MALQDPQVEPSMEEILASIRRIISEEEQATSAEVDSIQIDEPAPRPPSVADDIVLEAVEQGAAQAALPAPARRLQSPAVEPAATMLSPPNASAAAGALARLTNTLRIADTQDQTVEGVVRELLKPMLKDWLDQNLPAIVEARVEAELERIARMAR